MTPQKYLSKVRYIRFNISVRLSWKCLILVLHMDDYVVNGVIYIVFGNKSQWSHGDRFAFVGIRLHSWPFTRFCEF